jgi:16S rRNA (adenine1518-N6/adenine1519-N6)-dimethyltransferase
MIPVHDLDLFFRMAKAGFSQKRKQLRNAMSAGLHLEAGQIEKVLNSAGIDPTRRAQELSLVEWQRGFYELKEQGWL